MANLNTFVCASCCREVVVKDTQKLECPACGAILKRPVQATTARAEDSRAQPPAAGAGYR